MNNRHAHADMITAKAENMDLVVLMELCGKWVESNYDCLVSLSRQRFFLCLPQHNEEHQCLHWLNGGEIRGFYNDTEFGKLEIIGASKWHINHIWMDSSSKFRIKPLKNTRWIATFPWCGNDFYVTPQSFKSKDLLNKYIDMNYGKRGIMLTHEIEVEV